MAKNAKGEGSIYKWLKDGKPAGYKGAISYTDEGGTTKRYVAYRPHAATGSGETRQGPCTADRRRAGQGRQADRR